MAAEHYKISRLEIGNTKLAALATNAQTKR